jgi:hypothetical protein
MKAAALGHQYLTVKSLNTNDNYFGALRSRSLPKHGTQERLITPASDPLSGRSSFVHEPAEPSVSIITRSISDPNDPHVVYKSEPIKRGNDR